MNIKSKRDFLIGLVSLLLAVAAIIYGQISIQESGLTVSRGSMAPTSYPNFVLCALAVFSLLLIISTLKFKPTDTTETTRTPVKAASGDNKTARLRALAAMGLTALYIILMPLVGYVISSIVMLIAFIWLFGGRNLKIAALVSVGLSLALYWFFGSVMDVLMP